MKIGILTHPLETNYGGILQAFALQRVLKNYGYSDVYTIDRHNNLSYSSSLRHLLSFVYRNLKHFFTHQNVSTCWNPFISDSDFKFISRFQREFINQHIQLTKKISSEDLSVIDKQYKFDVYIVGSDQVWLPGYCPNSFLDFVNRDGVKKIFYAASCGASSFVDNEKVLTECKQLVKSFTAISVREEGLVDFTKLHLGRKAVWVLDPTLLLTKDDYLSLFKSNYQNSNFIFSYFLDRDNRKLDALKFISMKLHCPIHNGNVEKDYVKQPHINLDEYTFPSVESWLDGFANASFILTDSFHGTVFSILFNRPFLVFANPKRGMERFQSLLKKFGLESRLVTSLDEVHLKYNEPIDFRPVNILLESYRKDSLKFLLDNIK